MAVQLDQQHVRFVSAFFRSAGSRGPTDNRPAPPRESLLPLSRPGFITVLRMTNEPLPSAECCAQNPRTSASGTWTSIPGIRSNRPDQCEGRSFRETFPEDRNAEAGQGPPAGPTCQDGVCDSYCERRVNLPAARPIVSAAATRGRRRRRGMTCPTGSARRTGSQSQVDCLWKETPSPAPPAAP